MQNADWERMKQYSQSKKIAKASRCGSREKEEDRERAWESRISPIFQEVSSVSSLSASALTENQGKVS